MNRKMRWLPLLTALILVGCGGGGGGDFLTRETEATMDRDALALAARESTGMQVSLSLAKRINQELKEARNAFSALNTAHVRVENNPRVIRCILYNNAPWLPAWESGEWRTGIATIDDVLRPLHVASVRKVSVGEGTTVFELTFSQWVRTKAVAFSLYDKSPAIQLISLMPATDNTGDEDDPGLRYFVDTDGVLNITGGGLRINRIGGVWQEDQTEPTN